MLPEETPPAAPPAEPAAPPPPASEAGAPPAKSFLAAATASLRTTSSSVSPPPSAPETPATQPAGAPAATPPAPAEGETPPAEGETPPAEPPPPEGETPPPAEGETPPAGTPPDGEVPSDIDLSLVVELPARRPGEKPLPVLLDNPAVVERIRQLNNGYMRGEQARELEARAAEQSAAARRMRIEFIADPVGALEVNLNAEQRAIVARNLLVDPEVRQLLQGELRLLETADGLERLEDRAKRMRSEYKDARMGEVQTLETQERLVGQTSRLLDAVVQQLPDLPREAQDVLIEDLFRDIDAAESRLGKPILQMQQILEAIAPRLKLHHFSLDGGKPVRTTAPPARPSTPAARPGAPTTPPNPAAVVGAARVRADIKNATAAVASAGRAAPAVTSQSPLVPPKGATIAQATAHLRGVAAASAKPPS